MATALLADVVTPEIFTSNTLRETEVKSRLIRSGAVVVDSEYSEQLNGGGLSFNMPVYDDLDDAETENLATETDHHGISGGSDDPTPAGIDALAEISTRLERNKSWSASQLSKLLSGDDPLAAISARVSDWWVRKQQDAFVAVVNGLFADNAAAPGGGDQHLQNDMTVDITGASYTAGVTDFSAEAFIDSTLTMGDSMEDLTMVMMHSVVYARAQKNNLIDFIPDANGVVNIPTFLGRMVIVDDGVPSPSANIYETWMFGAGAILFGQGSPDVPTEVQRQAGAGNGAGQDVLWNRIRWGFHPKGHQYTGALSVAGPANAVLSAAGSWSRIAKERKQIKIARLISREA